MLRFAMTAVAAITACTLHISFARAEICVYRDAEGNVTYTNVKAAAPKGAKKIRCFEPETRAAPATNTPPRNVENAAKDFPKVDRDTQRERDAERRRILEEELAAEEQRLAQARQQLQEQESVRTGNERNYQRYLERVEPYREAVQNHERNVQALQRELQTLR
ncbi:MAG: DUF4124 domain-containing protein [Burkholderiales bacterium]